MHACILVLTPSQLESAKTTVQRLEKERHVLNKRLQAQESISGTNVIYISIFGCLSVCVHTSIATLEGQVKELTTSRRAAILEQRLERAQQEKADLASRLEKQDGVITSLREHVGRLQEEQQQVRFSGLDSVDDDGMQGQGREPRTKLERASLAQS